jgi:hypothetical protein
LRLAAFGHQVVDVVRDARRIVYVEIADARVPAVRRIAVDARVIHGAQRLAHLLADEVVGRSFGLFAKASTMLPMMSLVPSFSRRTRRSR